MMRSGGGRGKWKLKSKKAGRGRKYGVICFKLRYAYCLIGLVMKPVYNSVISVCEPLLETPAAYIPMTVIPDSASHPLLVSVLKSQQRDGLAFLPHKRLSEILGSWLWPGPSEPNCRGHLSVWPCHYFGQWSKFQPSCVHFAVICCTLKCTEHLLPPPSTACCHEDDSHTTSAIAPNGCHS